MPRIALIEDLTDVPIPAGSNILITYDGVSEWYAAANTMVAGWIRSGGRVFYHVTVRPPESIRQQLVHLGLDTEQLETQRKLLIVDWYSATLGQKSQEKNSFESLKVADMSIILAKRTREEPLPGVLQIADSLSCLARFNEEKAWVDFVLSRIIPGTYATKSTGIAGLLKGVHSEWVYRTLEGAFDGTIDFKLDETGENPQNLMRIRNIRNVNFEGRWHQLNVDENFKVSLAK